jgi:ribose 5-phosphate isomerase B
MNIAFGNDHAGISLREHVMAYLKKVGHHVLDFGTPTTDPVDFPDVAATVAQAILRGDAQHGIMVCGTGAGACIAANKIPGIRAAVAHDVYSAHQCVEHDDVNVLCIGAQIIGSKVADEIIDAFLNATFSTAPEFRRRVAKLAELERRPLDPALAKGATTAGRG